MNVSTKVRCPSCGGKGAPIKGGALRCKRCGGVYDGNNEGIVATHVDPVKSAELKERLERRKR